MKTFFYPQIDYCYAFHFFWWGWGEGWVWPCFTSYGFAGLNHCIFNNSLTFKIYKIQTLFSVWSWGGFGDNVPQLYLKPKVHMAYSVFQVFRSSSLEIRFGDGWDHLPVLDTILDLLVFPSPQRLTCRCVTPWLGPTGLSPAVSILKWDTAMGCICPLEVAAVIIPPVPSTLCPCQQLRFTYIHSCFPENCTGNSGRAVVVIPFGVINLLFWLTIPSEILLHLALDWIRQNWTKLHDIIGKHVSYLNTAMTIMNLITENCFYSVIAFLFTIFSRSHFIPAGWCSPRSNVFLITACVFSYLLFFYQRPPHMQQRRGWLMVSACDVSPLSSGAQCGRRSTGPREFYIKVCNTNSE